ncbi:hypothetical protein [Brevibacterium sediminis]|uniref:Uncharacterized protein n=1 Tax=Brevibacterium sediminis TaxID=1857024 RepID=A0A5C4X2A3_9MICO|nr:hypothetical protein [Brevibacterium sediminis]TNM55352.1 hypothetical protein FHQ09_09140 [Brevibacterium sediminis]
MMLIQVSPGCPSVQKPRSYAVEQAVSMWDIIRVNVTGLLVDDSKPAEERPPSTMAASSVHVASNAEHGTDIDVSSLPLIIPSKTDE